MKRLKIILQSKIFYIIIFLLALIWILNNTKEKESIYNINDNEFIGIIKNYKIEEKKLVIDLDSKEDLVIRYYFKNKDEFLKYKDIIKYGLKIRINGEIKEVNNNTIFNTFNYKKYLNNKGIYYIVNAQNIEILDSDVNFINVTKNILRKQIDKRDEKGYLLAFILGDKTNIKIYDRYQRIGVAHLFAISGMHIGFLSMVFLKILRKVKIKYVIVDLFLIIYGFIVGYPSSVLRCILFFILNSVLKYLKIDISNVRLLCIVSFIIILLDSNIIYDIGFLYSVSTVGGIFLFTKFIKSNNKILGMFKLGIITFLFSLPITLYNYYSFNILSIIFNMFYIPLVSSIIYPLAILSMMIPWLINIFNIFVNVLESITSFLDNLKFLNIYMSFNIVYAGLYYLILVIFFKFNKKRYLLLLVFLIIGRKIEPLLDSNAYVYLFDVGQGDCSLIIGPNKRDIVMIDTGGLLGSDYHVSDNVISFLKYKGIKSIDSLVISHGDYDHMGDANNIVNNFSVDKVIFNNDNFNELETQLIKVLDNKKINYYQGLKDLNGDEYKLEFLNTKKYDNENDNSNIICFNFKNFKFLFMGDAGVEKEKDILKKYNLEDIDFLKVGHHGSDTSSSKIFIDNINPKYSLISVGKNNRYGHPKKSVLNTLSNSHIYRTDLDGSIEIKLNKNGYKVRTCSP